MAHGLLLECNGGICPMSTESCLVMPCCRNHSVVRNVCHSSGSWQGQIHAFVPIASDIIRLVEHLLNLLWLVVVSALFAATVIGDRRGKLPCSLPVALGAVVLLAIVLFPAVSMTDDLQRAKLAAEMSWQQNGGSCPGTRSDGPVAVVALLPSLLLLMLFGLVLRRMRLIALRRAMWKMYALVPSRSESPRPPPCACAA